MSKSKIAIIYEEYDISSDTIVKSYCYKEGNVFNFLTNDLIFLVDDNEMISLETIIDKLNNKDLTNAYYHIEYLPLEDDNDNEEEDY